MPLTWTLGPINNRSTWFRLPASCSETATSHKMAAGEDFIHSTNTLSSFFSQTSTSAAHCPHSAKPQVRLRHQRHGSRSSQRGWPGCTFCPAHGHPSAHPCTQKDLTFLELCQCAVKIGGLLPARQQRSRFNPQKKARKQHLWRAVSVSEPLHRQGFSPSSVFLQPWGLQRKQERLI